MNAEEVPLPDASFRSTVPLVSVTATDRLRMHVLRPGVDELLRDYFDMHRFEWPDEGD